MAITRGQMQRQLRQSGGIMNAASETIGGGDYAGIPMGSRTGFGILKKIKKRVRKIIPNEIADIVTKAAPFVAPFNPIVAGAMAGIGSFDQTGNVADAFKRGALTFGGGQLARFIGGAGFQDPSLSAFTPSGFRAGFSSPLGTETGLGKFLDQRNQQAAARAIAEQGKTNKAAFDAGISEVTGVGGEKFVTADAATDFVSKVKNPVKGDTNFIGELFGNIKNKDYPAVADQLLEGTKSIGKMIFFDDKGNLDKSAVLAAASMAASYKEAKELADDAGVDITEEEYDEAKKADKKEEYAGYLQNFFGGKKDGGRIGYRDGSLTGNFGKDRFLAEMIETYRRDLDRASEFTDELEGILATEKFPDPETLKRMRKEYDDIEGRFGRSEDIFKSFEDKVSEKDKNTFYGKKIMDLEKRLGDEEKRLDDADTKFGKTKFDASDITRTPNFQSWLRLYEKGDPLAKENPYHDEFEEILFSNLKGRDQSYKQMVGKKDGGRIGFARGTDLNKSDEIEEFKKLISGDIIENEDPDMKDMDDLMAGGGISFSRAEKSFLFRRLGGAGGSDRSYTMPQLYRILSNPNSPSNIGDATILKQIAVVGLGGKKDGGRIELGTGSRPSQLFKLLEEAEAAGDMDKVKEIKSDLFKEFGLKLAMGGEVPVRKNKAGIEELDYRESGGFVPVGVKERADDVPAMLSKNEFVMTADAVRGIGDGSVEKGAQKLYNVMKQAEKVGKA